jgi:hypothetical protein
VREKIMKSWQEEKEKERAMLEKKVPRNKNKKK